MNWAVQRGFLTQKYTAGAANDLIIYLDRALVSIWRVVGYL